jgi:hypothetical protein
MVGGFGLKANDEHVFSTDERQCFPWKAEVLNTRSDLTTRCEGVTLGEHNQGAPMKILAIIATLITMSAALVAVFFLYDMRNDVWFQYHSTQRLNVAMQAMHATIGRLETLETEALQAATKGGPKEAKVVLMCRDDIVDGDSQSRGRHSGDRHGRS